MAQNFVQRVDDKAHQSAVSEHELTLPKKLIVCCDGTWMNSDNGWVKGRWGRGGHLLTPSNVTRITRAISAEDDAHHPQIVYYQAGIGSGIGLYNHLVGGGTGLGLAENIREAYAFLADNYRESDRGRPGVESDSIFLIGFSRGAFTARSIGGLVGAVGILKKRAMPHFYEIFSDWENAGSRDYTPLFFDRYFDQRTDVEKVKPSMALARDRNRIDDYMAEYFKLLRSLDLTQEAQIQSIGVWDTVGSLGIPINPVMQRLFPFLPSYVREYSWFDTGLAAHVKNAFQALALDEHRYPFSPTLWEKKKDCPTNLKQVWFPGAHSNVGGSYTDESIANATLAWMMDQLSGNSTEHPNGLIDRDWIKFDEDYIESWQSAQLEWFEKQKRTEYLGWAMGYVYESNYFPLTLLGSRVREPGRYHRTFYESGKTDMKHLLENTNEIIHASVRARIDLAGMSVQNDWNQVFPKGISITPLIVYFLRWLVGRDSQPYQPQRRGGPLYGWRLVDGHNTHFKPNMNIDMSPQEQNKITWVYEGTEPCSRRELPEDKLGPFEIKLLERDQKVADQIIFSDAAWHWFKRPLNPSRRHSHTV